MMAPMLSMIARRAPLVNVPLQCVHQRAGRGHNGQDELRGRRGYVHWEAQGMNQHGHLNGTTADAQQAGEKPYE